MEWLLLFSDQVVSNFLWPHAQQHAQQHASLPCHLPSPGVCPSSCPLSWWCHPTISSYVALFSFCLQSFLLHQGLFQWVSCSHEVAKVLELQHQIFQRVFRVDFLKDWSDLLASHGTLKSLYKWSIKVLKHYIIHL